MNLHASAKYSRSSSHAKPLSPLSKGHFMYLGECRSMRVQSKFAVRQDYHLRTAFQPQPWSRQYRFSSNPRFWLRYRAFQLEFSTWEVGCHPSSPALHLTQLQEHSHCLTRHPRLGPRNPADGCATGRSSWSSPPGR